MGGMKKAFDESNCFVVFLTYVYKKLVILEKKGS